MSTLFKEFWRLLREFIMLCMMLISLPILLIVSAYLMYKTHKDFSELPEKVIKTMYFDRCIKLGKQVRRAFGL